MRRLLPPATLLAVLCVAAGTSGAATVGGQPVIDTEITAGPADGAVIEDETPSFSFAATADGVPLPTATFHCSVDSGAPVDCTSPYELEALDQEGRHTFSVYAEEPVTKAVDPEPATRQFFLEFEEEDECEELGEELEDEEGNVEICEGGATPTPYPPEECLLRTARARVFAYTAHDKIRLVIRYTSFAPADVLVGYRLTGGKGSLVLDSAKAHFAKKGLYRVTERLSKSQAAKVRAAKRFTVTLDIPGAPDYCHRFDTRHLTVKRTIHSQEVWFQSDSIFGAKP